MLLAATLALLPVPAALAQPPGEGCRLDIQIEGVADEAALKGKLRADAVTHGACTRAWTLRISPGPKGQFVIGLWNGSNLETRWATNRREVEAVSALLLRVAVEQAQAQEPVGPPASGAPASGASGPSQPPSGGAPPAAAPAPSGRWFEAGVGVGPAWSQRAGWGAEVGAVVSYGGGGLRWGLGPGLSRVSDGGRARLGLVLPLRVEAQLRASPGLALGVFGEVGLDVEWAEGQAAGATATEQAAGLALGGGVLARWQAAPSWWLGAMVPVRYATTTAAARTEVTTMQRNGPPVDTPGQGGTKAPKTTTETTALPASSDAVGRLGGVTLAVSLALSHTF